MRRFALILTGGLLAGAGPAASGAPSAPGGPAAASAPAASLAPAAAVTLDSLLAGFRQSPGLYARFREEKHIALLAAPLVNEGTLHYDPPGRFARHVDTPAPQSLLVDGAVLRFADGQSQEKVDLGAHPVVRQFVATFLDLVAGDRARLDATYQTSFSVDAADPQSWVLSLTPRAAPMNQVFREVRLTGRALVLRGMVIREVAGDESVTTFTEVDVARRYADGDRAALFRLRTP